MKSIEAEAKSKEEAIALALTDLNLDRSQVQVEVLEEGTKGFLGVGGKRARVRVSELGEGGAGPVKVVHRLLELMGVDFKLDVRQQGESTEIRIDAPEDEGLLIGRRGQTLDAIRHVAQRIIAANEGRNVVVNIDVGDYRARREEALRQKGIEAAQEVIEKGHGITLEPMSAQDRRVVHMALADHEGLHTYTVGNGARRRVVIAPGGRDSRRSRDLEDLGPVSESATAYDRVPDPGFKPARIVSSERNAEDRESSSEERRPPQERRPRQRSRSRDRGDRPRSRDQREDAGRGDRDGRPRSRDQREDAGREDWEGRPRSRDQRENAGREDREGRPRSRDQREGAGRIDRDERPARGRTESRDRRPRDEQDSPASYYQKSPDEPASDEGERELSQAPEVVDGAEEKPFSSTLARQILQLDKNNENTESGEKPAPAGRRRTRRR